MSLHGSFLPEDVTFLLQEVALRPVSVAEKERLIQSGEAHYSELITAEAPPTEAYLRCFHEGLRTSGARMARDVAALARALAERPGEEVVLVSLARAGTPVGVLLGRALAHLGRRAPHYAVSIIRDRGIDTVALDHILSRHAPEDLVFVDGWTGKGAISRQLEAALATYRDGLLPPRLVVLADLAGTAWLAASSEDYPIPSGILGAVISGLLSRTILREELVAPGTFHGCVATPHLAGHDLSRWFADRLTAEVLPLLETTPPARWTEAQRQERRELAQAFVERATRHFGIRNDNRVKPGVGEATRAVLRRVPHRVLLRTPTHPATAALEQLIADQGLPTEIWPDMPYRAVTIIERLG